MIGIDHIADVFISAWYENDIAWLYSFYNCVCYPDRIGHAFFAHMLLTTILSCNSARLRVVLYPDCSSSSLLAIDIINHFFSKKTWQFFKLSCSYHALVIQDCEHHQKTTGS